MVWTMVGICAPQADEEKFFNTVITQIEQHAERNVLLMGDFNCVMDKEMDV